MKNVPERNGIKPNEESWSWIMKECVKSGNFRIGYVIERVMKEESARAAVVRNDEDCLPRLEHGRVNCCQ